jgi:hypothetical protein
VLQKNVLTVFPNYAYLLILVEEAQINYCYQQGCKFTAQDMLTVQLIYNLQNGKYQTKVEDYLQMKECRQAGQLRWDLPT